MSTVCKHDGALRITLGENCHDQEGHRSQHEHVSSETRHFSSFFRECEGRERKRGYRATTPALASIAHSIKAGNHGLFRFLILARLRVHQAGCLIAVGEHRRHLHIAPKLLAPINVRHVTSVEGARALACEQQPARDV